MGGDLCNDVPIVCEVLQFAAYSIVHHTQCRGVAVLLNNCKITIILWIFVTEGL